MATLSELLESNNSTGWSTKQINPLLIEAVRLQFHRAIRNDLIKDYGYHRGWKGILLRTHV
jgi:hypothetical protein